MDCQTIPTGTSQLKFVKPPGPARFQELFLVSPVSAACDKPIHLTSHNPRRQQSPSGLRLPCWLPHDAFAPASAAPHHLRPRVLEISTPASTPGRAPND